MLGPPEPGTHEHSCGVVQVLPPLAKRVHRPSHLQGFLLLPLGKTSVDCDGCVDRQQHGSESSREAAVYEQRQRDGAHEE